MASSQPPSHRPPFPHQGSSYRSDYGPQNGRPSPVNTHSPQMMTYGSPSPQYSPSYIQPPAAKRPRLSEGPNQAFSPPHYPQSPIGQSRSPVGGPPPNGLLPSVPRPGSMPPPQRPADRNKDDDNYEDVLTGTGVNVEEEERNLSRPDYYSHNSFQNQYPNRQGTFDYQNNSHMATNGIVHQPHDGQQHQPIPDPSPEERQRRIEARADWEAARFSQNPLWDMFLYGGNLNDKIRKISNRERLLDPQSGVLINTQKTGPPPVARVNGLEGATRIIDRGQAILDSQNKGQRLSEIMSLVCLATKTRLTGLMNASARLSIERRQHSKGIVPAEWEDVAVAPRATSEAAETGVETTATPSLKREFRSRPFPGMLILSQVRFLKQTTSPAVKTRVVLWLQLQGSCRIFSRQTETLRRHVELKERNETQPTTLKPQRQPVQMQQQRRRFLQRLKSRSGRLPRKNKSGETRQSTRHSSTTWPIKPLVWPWEELWGRRGRT